MDIYPFIDSQAIREHLQKLDYHFNAEEAVYLIWHSQKRTLEEKLSAWQEIAETTADDVMLLNRQEGTEVSLRKILGAYVDERKKEIENFQKGKDCVYFYRYEEYEADSPMKPSWTMRSEQGFRDYKSCCDHFRREVEEEYQEERKQKLRNLQIERYDLAGTIRCKTASVNTRIQLTDFEPSPFQEEDSAGAVIDFNILCSNMCIDIPAPFCRGDLVCHSDGKPFVLDYIAAWDRGKWLENGFSEEEAEQGDQERTRCFQNGNCFGMWTYGYEIRENFGVWYKDLGYREYLDLEYYERPLEGKERALKLISEYLKGNCDLELLLNGYVFGLLDGKQKQILGNYHSAYTKEWRKIMGLDA